MSSGEIARGVTAALEGRWEEAHEVAQNNPGPAGNWLHAVVHKIEGDAWNSRYWYARTAGRKYEDVADPKAELLLLQQSLK